MTAPTFNQSGGAALIDGGAMTATTTLLAWSGAQPQHAGMQIRVKGAGAGGADLVTTVSSVVANVSLTLAAAAGTTVGPNALFILGEWAANTNGTTNILLTVAGAIAAGDGLLVALNYDPSVSPAPTLSDGVNVYGRPAGSPEVQAGNYAEDIRYVLAAAAAAAGTLVLTATWPSTVEAYASMSVVHFSGNGNTFALDKYAAAQGTGTAVASGSVTTGGTAAVACGFTGVASHATAGGAGWTVATTEDAYGDLVQYQIVAAPTALNSQATQASASQWVASIVSLTATPATAPKNNCLFFNGD